MKQHERILTGDKLLICHVCEKRFTTRQAVLHTVVDHTGEEQVKINIEDAYASAASPKVTMSPVKEEELPSLRAIRLDKDLSKFADFVSMPSLKETLKHGVGLGHHNQYEEVVRYFHDGKGLGHVLVTLKVDKPFDKGRLGQFEKHGAASFWLILLVRRG